MSVKWRVDGDWWGPFSTYERALRRARHLRDTLKRDFTVIEVEDRVFETPVAEVCFKPAPAGTAGNPD